MKHRILLITSLVVVCALLLVFSVGATEGCTNGDCPPDPGCTNGDCPPDPGCTNGDCPYDPGCTNGDCPVDPGCTDGDCPPDPGCTDGGCPGYYLLEIDIKPGSSPNCFNNDGHGVIPVAILGAEYFHVSRIDPGTISMSGLSVKVVGKSDKLLAHIEDVNGDGYDDLVVQIQDTDGMFVSGTGTAMITGYTKGLEPHLIQGSDSLCIVP